MPIDSHCHVHFKAFQEDSDAIIEASRVKGWQMITIGTNLATSASAVECARVHAGIVYATVGLHPVHLFSSYVDELEGDAFTSRSDKFDYDGFLELARQPEVVAIGETGLDYFHIEKASEREKEIAKQKEVFLEQLRLAHEVDKPLVLHCRDALHDLADLMQAHPELITRPAGKRGTVHCFTGVWEEAKRFLDMGFNIGFTGIITYKPKASEPGRQEALLDVVRNMPLERILVETDAPYLAPIPYRGKRAEPWMAEEVIKKIAELKGLPVEKVAAQTEKNTKELFGI
ncbi:MAG TPA: hydrolase TatD [Candidatus Magasanikbacteria bacterium]|nr:hydrolase TatD [Candidatus Magasanikbacteria bacterium]